VGHGTLRRAGFSSCERVDIYVCVYAGVDTDRGQSYKAALKTDATPRASSSGSGGGGLSRSHSSPNIAKMIQDEDAEAALPASQLPRQLAPDRSTKPNTMYAVLTCCVYLWQPVAAIVCETM